MKTVNKKLRELTKIPGEDMKLTFKLRRTYLILKRTLERCSSCGFECYVGRHAFDTKAVRMKFHLSVVAESFRISAVLKEVPLGLSQIKVTSALYKLFFRFLDIHSSS